MRKLHLSFAIRTGFCLFAAQQYNALATKCAQFENGEDNNATKSRNPPSVAISSWFYATTAKLPSVIAVYLPHFCSTELVKMNKA